MRAWLIIFIKSWIHSALRHFLLFRRDEVSRSIIDKRTFKFLNPVSHLKDQLISGAFPPIKAIPKNSHISISVLLHSISSYIYTYS